MAPRCSAAVGVSLLGILGLGVGGGVVEGGPGCSPAHAQTQDYRPLLLDWSIRNKIPEDLPVIPIPHPGADFPAAWAGYLDLQLQLIAEGLPVGIMLRGDTAPLDGTIDPFALQTVLSWSVKMDYVFGDFESPLKNENVLAMVAQVKAADSRLVSSALIGAYAYFPGPMDPAAAYPFQVNRQAASDFYLNSGLTVAMPNCYPYAFFATHVNPVLWGDNVAPNIRSALFWAPITRHSITKKALPKGHVLIPWVTNFLPWSNFPDVPPPPKEDASAIVQHLRLRGADGYYLLLSYLEDYPTDQLRLDLLAAWEEFDGFFETATSPTVLNLETDKTSGVQWSGMSADGVGLYIVSNLGNADAEVSIVAPDGKQVTIPAPQGKHFSFTLTDGSPADLNGDGDIDGADLGLLMGSWGECSGCAADLSGDGAVAGDDLGILLSGWTG